MRKMVNAKNKKGRVQPCWYVLKTTYFNCNRQERATNLHACSWIRLDVMCQNFRKQYVSDFYLKNI